MSQPNTFWLYNNTTNDGANTGNASGGAGGGSSNWVVIDRANDTLMFLDDQQSDGDPNTGTIYPVLIPTAASAESDKTFVNNDSDDILDQVNLAGTTNGGQSGGNTRYVFAIYFDGATATIPYLEAWDDSDHSTYSSDFLGTGDHTQSTIYGITTTNGAPGSTTWAGTPLAGTSGRISLDTGALAGAQNCYFNMKQVLPTTFTPQSDSNIVLTLRFTYN